jgi:hypothetical protein
MAANGTEGGFVFDVDLGQAMDGHECSRFSIITRKVIKSSAQPRFVKVL